MRTGGAFGDPITQDLIPGLFFTARQSRNRTRRKLAAGAAINQTGELHQARNLAQLARLSAGFSLGVRVRFFSTFPHTAQMAGIVVTSPTTAKVAPIVLRSSLVNRSANKRASPAPRIARVATIMPSSAKSRRTTFTLQPALDLRMSQTKPAINPPHRRHRCSLKLMTSS
jgi:hypothetical protein